MIRISQVEVIGGSNFSCLIVRTTLVDLWRNHSSLVWHFGYNSIEGPTSVTLDSRTEEVKDRREMWHCSNTDKSYQTFLTSGKVGLRWWTDTWPIQEGCFTFLIRMNSLLHTVVVTLSANGKQLLEEPIECAPHVLNLQLACHAWQLRLTWCEKMKGDKLKGTSERNKERNKWTITYFHDLSVMKMWD